jgi:hypothetical protein
VSLDPVCAVTWDRADTIFLVTRNDTGGIFLAYSIANNAWCELPPPPEMPGYGTALAAEPNGTYVLLLTSSDTASGAVYKYSRSSGTWSLLQAPPWSVDVGAAMCHSDTYAFALTGDSTTPGGWFWRFDPNFGSSSFGRSFGVASGRPFVRSAFTCQCYPNPFTKRTEVHWEIPVEANVSIVVYDVTGRAVRVLHSGRCHAGAYSMLWDGKTADQRRLASGVYILRLKAGEYTSTHKLVLTE